MPKIKSAMIVPQSVWERLPLEFGRALMSAAKWQLEVYCRRGGVTRDAGVHRTYDHEPSEAEVAEELTWLRRHGGYDEISHAVRRVEVAP